jgi:membrane protease YdiL (CAAX protease family)
MENRSVERERDGDGYPWRLFFLLVISAVASVLALLPYLQALLGPVLVAHPLPLPLPLLVLVQGTINFSVATGLGLLAARALGLGAPIVEDWLYGRPPPPAQRRIGMVSVMTGFVLGVVTLLLIISPAGAPLRSIAPLETALPLWKRLLACAYGGLGEEILMRLFLLSVLLWVLTKIFRASPRNTILFWSANLLAALAFGAGHLPAAASLHILTPSLVVTVIGLNAFVALGFGYLYWSRGLEAAMLAHFTADLVLHLIGPGVVKS